MTRSQVGREFRLLQTAGELRTAEFDNREHLIVPVIALMEGVIHPVNADSPELVLEAELAKVAAAWNGEPALWDHPNIGGERVSANDPRVLEQYQIGTLFNAEVREGKLHVEVWIDRAKVTEMGGAAAKLLSRVEAGELVEVSVGAFVISENKDGMHNGMRFSAVWREIYPDHLALLPEGTVGACSNEMGCGAPRTAASLHTLDADGLLCAPTEATPDMRQKMDEPRQSDDGGIIAKLLEPLRGLGSLISAKGTEGMSDADLRRVLDQALFNVEPAFMGIEAVFADTVVYQTGVDGDFQLFKRSFEVGNADDEATFGEPEAMRLEVETNFVPATAADDCGTEPEEIDMDKATRVAALIENETTPYTAEDSEALTAMSDATLDQLEAAAVEAEPEVVAEVEAEAVDDAGDDGVDEEPMTASEWMAAAPPEISAVVQRQLDQEATHRAELIKQLAGAQDVFDAAALGAKSTPELTDLCRLVKVDEPAPADFSGLGIPRAASSRDSDNVVAAAPTLATAIAKRNGVEITN